MESRQEALLAKEKHDGRKAVVELMKRILFFGSGESIPEINVEWVDAIDTIEVNVLRMETIRAFWYGYYYTDGLITHGESVRLDRNWVLPGSYEYTDVVTKANFLVEEKFEKYNDIPVRNKTEYKFTIVNGFWRNRNWQDILVDYLA